MKYRTRADRPKKVDKISAETPDLIAAVEFISAVDEAETPTWTNLLAVRNILSRLINGADSQVMFGLKAPGRSPEQGFRKADIISAFIELRRRQIGHGGLAKAKQEAAAHFVEFQKPMELASREREINRYWAQGRKRAQILSSADLEAILEPHKVTEN